MVCECVEPATNLPRGWELERRDFFRTRAQMPLSDHFLITGMSSRFSTNSGAILACARTLFASLPDSGRRAEIDFRLWVDPNSSASTPPWPKPYFRGLGRFVFAGFDRLNSLLVDLPERRVIGRFTPTFAEDRAVWKRVVFPIIPAVLGASIPVSILHGACVEYDGNGLLLAGPSGAGKSTLTCALGRQGFGYLADDRTYLSLRDGRLFAWGAGGLLKLRSDAGRHFPEAEKINASTRLTGEMNLELDPEDDLGFKRAKCCEPRCLVFLRRDTDSSPELRELRPDEAAALLDRDLISEANDKRLRNTVIHRLAQLPSFTLDNGGSVGEVTQSLKELVEHSEKFTASRIVSYLPRNTRYKATRPDPLRRATPLNYLLPIEVMGRAGRLETNSKIVLECARALFPKCGTASNSTSMFIWRIVSDTDASMFPPWPTSAAFSSGTLRFVNIGQRSFVAIHLGTAEAAGFISEGLTRDGPGFAGVFLATLFYLTAPILGLTPLKAGCVSQGGKGLLLLGPHGSGKTTSAYAGSKMGLEFHSDMATFLEPVDGHLRAWGEFWPALFREDAARSLPELMCLGQLLRHESETFISVDKGHLCGQPPRSVEPAVAVVLDRGATESPRLTRLAPGEFSGILQASLPHEESGSFKEDQQKVLAKLGMIPAYKFAYGNDPAEAAKFCRSLLNAQDILKAVK